MSQNNNERLFVFLQRGRWWGAAVKTPLLPLSLQHTCLSKKRKKKTKEKWNLFSLILNVQQIIPCHTSHNPTLGPGLKGVSWKPPQVLSAGWRIHSEHLNYTDALTDALEEPREED